MPAYNAEKYIAEAIDSVLKQSFTDFEFIIVDDGSTDSTLSIIRAYSDKRIVLIENSHDFIASLNIGLNTAKGKYIARMDADDIMHIDRLRIQYSIMEEEPSITVCSSWVELFGQNINTGAFSQSGIGLIEDPLLQLLNLNFVSNSSAIIRREFLCRFGLIYEMYPIAQDYKLWIEVAKHGGVFYIEPQYLLRYRISKSQISHQRKNEQLDISLFIKEEILHYLIDSLLIGKNELLSLKNSLEELRQIDIVNKEDIYRFFYSLFVRNKKLVLDKK